MTIYTYTADYWKLVLIDVLAVQAHKEDTSQTNDTPQGCQVVDVRLGASDVPVNRGDNYNKGFKGDGG